MIHSSKGFKLNCRIKKFVKIFCPKFILHFPRSVNIPLGHIFAAHVTYGIPIIHEYVHTYVRSTTHTYSTYYTYIRKYVDKLYYAYVRMYVRTYVYGMITTTYTVQLAW